MHTGNTEKIRQGVTTAPRGNVEPERPRQGTVVRHSYITVAGANGDSAGGCGVVCACNPDRCYTLHRAPSLCISRRCGAGLSGFALRDRAAHSRHPAASPLHAPPSAQHPNVSLRPVVAGSGRTGTATNGIRRRRSRRFLWSLLLWTRRQVVRVVGDPPTRQSSRHDGVAFPPLVGRVCRRGVRC